MSIGYVLKTYYPIYGLKGLILHAVARLLHTTPIISLRVPGLGHPVHFRVGTMDPTVFSGVLLGGEYRFDYPGPVRVIVDAGANIGMASLFYAREYPQARIFAIEPEPGNFSLLCKNVSGYPNVTPIHAALWDRPGQLCLEGNGDRNTDAYRVNVNSKNGTHVEAINMDQLIATYGIQTIDILKVDIEGAEVEVFLDSASWLPRVRSLAIEFHERLRPGSEAMARSVLSGFATTIRRKETDFYVA